MEFENILEESKKVKVKKKFTIPLIIIAVILLALISLVLFLFFGDVNPKDLYISMIDEVKTSIINEILTDDDIVEPYSLKGNINMNLLSENATYQDIANIINNIDIDYNIEMDEKNIKANYDFDIKYEQGDLINLGMTLNNDSMYFNLGSLFDKDIRMVDEELKTIWEVVDYGSYKIIVEEFLNTLKSNLKDEYFSKERELLEIESKKILITKYIMTLSSKDICDIEINVIDNLKNNNKFLEEVAKLTNVTTNDVLDELNSYKNEITEDSSMSLKVEIYLNSLTKKFVKASISDQNEIIEIINKDKTLYNINYTENDLTSLVGTFELSDEYIKLNYSYDKINVELDLTETELNFNYSEGTTILNMNFSLKDEECSYLIEITAEEDDIKLKVSFDGVMKNIDKITEKINTNYIDIENLTDSDYATIYERIYQNNTLLSLIEDISSVNFVSNILTY